MAVALAVAASGSSDALCQECPRCTLVDMVGVGGGREYQAA